MAQTTLSVVLEVVPASSGLLSRLIDDFTKAEDVASPSGEHFATLKMGVPTLHFLSLSVFDGRDYDPVFVIEASFDGPAGPFWGQLEAVHGERVRAMLRCCKRPGDSRGPLFDAVTKETSRYPVAPYLEVATERPSVYHHGNRGLDRQRIERESDLFLAARTVLANATEGSPNPAFAMSEVEIHRHLRETLRSDHRWLHEPAPPRIPPLERAADFARLALFVYAALVVLSLPGLALWPITPSVRFAVLFIAGIVVAGLGLSRMRAPLAGKGAAARSGGLTLASLSRENATLSPAHPIGLLIWIGGFVAFYLLVASLVGAALLVPVTGRGYGHLLRPTFWALLSSLVTSVAFCALAMVVWLRWLERRDSSHDAPPIDERMLREMTHREDRIAQNHMGSVVLVKPGVLRMALFRAGHLGLHLVLRVVATDGYLGSMRTVHFAHWAFVNNGSRLMFFSNFDHSWDSYLDDFIEKAHGGLTLAWGSCVGFPATRFLVLDGASHGRQFKAWARHSMAVSRFWFSAYKDLTVDQIERQARIANGLRKPELTSAEAAAWAMDL